MIGDRPRVWPTEKVWGRPVYGLREGCVVVGNNLNLVIFSGVSSTGTPFHSTQAWDSTPSSPARTPILICASSPFERIHQRNASARARQWVSGIRLPTRLKASARRCQAVSSVSALNDSGSGSIPPSQRWVRWMPPVRQIRATPSRQAAGQRSWRSFFDRFRKIFSISIG